MNWAAAFFYSVVAVCVAALVGKWMDEVAGRARRVAASKPELTEEEARTVPARETWTW